MSLDAIARKRELRLQQEQALREMGFTRIPTETLRPQKADFTFRRWGGLPVPPDADILMNRPPEPNPGRGIKLDRNKVKKNTKILIKKLATDRVLALKRRPRTDEQKQARKNEIAWIDWMLGELKGKSHVSAR